MNIGIFRKSKSPINAATRTDTFSIENSTTFFLHVLKYQQFHPYLRVECVQYIKLILRGALV